MQLKIEHLSFTYDGAPEAVFADLSLSLDTVWRTGLIARNGRGKTTLLRLLSGDLQGKGKIDCPLTPVLFPYPVADGTQTAWQIAQTAAATCEDWRLMRELSLLNVPEEALNRPFDTLSGGEQTRVMLSALFAREDAYPLIDEPTNSLDAPGRAMLADYLRRKDGFLLVSHDRAFLNRAIDHVVCLNKANTYVMQGNYDTFEARLNGENEAEAARNDALRKEIKQLEAAARKTAEWSNRAEENKRHADKSFYGKVDRGFLGAASGDRYPFALMWANRMPRRVLPVRRTDTPVIEAERLVPADVEDFVAFVRHVAERYFVRPNYLRVDGRAYFSIFDSTHFMKELGAEGVRLAIARARAMLASAGFPPMYLTAIEPNAEWIGQVAGLGFDAVTNYVLLPEWKGPFEQDYQACHRARVAQWPSIAAAAGLPYHPSVTPGWDASPRGADFGATRPDKYPWSPVVTGEHPTHFRAAIADAVAYARGASSRDEARLVFVASLNEWSEGHYLEPDTRFGTAWIEAVRDGRA